MKSLRRNADLEGVRYLLRLMACTGQSARALAPQLRERLGLGSNAEDAVEMIAARAQAARPAPNREGGSRDHRGDTTLH